MADSYYVYTALQRMTPQDVTDFVLDQFELLHDTYQQDKHLIPQGATLPRVGGCMCVDACECARVETAS